MLSRFNSAAAQQSASSKTESAPDHSSADANMRPVQQKPGEQLQDDLDWPSDCSAPPSQQKFANDAVSDVHGAQQKSQAEDLYSGKSCSPADMKPDHAQPGAPVASHAGHPSQDVDISSSKAVKDRSAQAERQLQSTTILMNDLVARVGLRPYTIGGMPLIGPLPGFPRVVIAAGHEGSGLTLGPATAELVLHHLCSEMPIFESAKVESPCSQYSILHPRTALAVAASAG